MESIEEKVILRIRDYLKAHPKADINTIASDIDSNWATTRNKLNILVALGDVNEERIGGRRCFSWVGGCSPGNTPNTLFGLKVRDGDYQLMRWLYSKIKTKCVESFERTPSKTISQKIAVEVIRQCELKIPVGWYLYGEVTVVMPSEEGTDVSIPAEYQSMESRLNDSITEWVKFYGGLTPYQAEVKQYQKHGKQLYQLKYNLIHNLYDNTFSNSEFRDNLFRFAMNIKTPREDIRDLANAFIDLSIVLVSKKLDKKRADEVREKLISAFNEVWRCVALSEFHSSLLAGGYYEKLELDACLDEKMDTYLYDARQNVMLLNELLPLGTENDPLRTFKGVSTGQNPDKSGDQLFEEFKAL